jgi:alpha-tubulin suppressor-like RCC1 family protein
MVMLATALAAGLLAVASDAAGAGVPTGPGSVAAGGAHACALAAGQTVKCWGLNNAGQLGNGSSGNGLIAKKPVSVIGLKGVSAVAAGDSHSCALLKFQGTVECWGLNNAGQLGNGTRKNSTKPVGVLAVGGKGRLSGVIAIAAAGSHTCALRSADVGIVECWGQNSAGVLGNGSGTRLQSLVPESVNGLTRVIAISTSSDDTCALLKGGTLKCWGFNQYGELGPGMTYGPNSCDTGDVSFGCSTTPMTVKGITNVIAVSVRPHSTCAVVKNGRVICWGENISPHSVVAKGFVTMNGVAGATAISGPGDVAVFGADEYACALLASKAVKCWGSNQRGQLGNGSTTDSTVPTTVATKSFGSAISAGADFACARMTLGPVVCWGDNGYGQLGNGGSPSHNVPVFVSGL